MNTKRPRRLDLNAPLLSTRRSTTTTTTGMSRTNSMRGFCDRVPFSWEKSPGKPKDGIRREIIEAKAWPLPKPPPIRWLEEATLPYDEGCEGDVDDDDNNDNNYYNNNDDDDGGFSDAIDLFSLAESLNTSEKQEKETTRDEDIDFVSDFGGYDNKNGSSSSPNFMIQRFLPAATALAASSLSALTAHQDIRSTNITANNKQLMSVYSSRNCKEESCIPRAYSSSKGCGLVMLFPWRAKNRVSGVTSPVRRARSSLKRQLKQRPNKYK